MTLAISGVVQCEVRIHRRNNLVIVHRILSLGQAELHQLLGYDSLTKFARLPTLPLAQPSFERLPSILQSALQYFSLNHPRNLRLQTRHVLRTFWSVVSKGLFLAFLLSRCLLPYPSTGIKSNCTDTAITKPVRACLCLLLPLDSAE